MVKKFQAPTPCVDTPLTAQGKAQAVTTAAYLLAIAQSLLKKHLPP